MQRRANAWAALLVAAVPALGPGYSLDDTWGAAWRRLLDRTGLPDPAGGALQRFAGRQGSEYQLNLAVAELPLSLERAFAARPSGARFWVQSLDEFDLANRAELKVRAPLWERGRAALAFHRVATRETQSELLRFELGTEAILGTGVFAAIAFYPRWEKDDSDVEGLVGLRAPWGEARFRILGLDPFTNASFALAESRGAVLRQHLWQEDLPLGFSLEAVSADWRGLRGELYLGGALPARTRYQHPDQAQEDHRRERTAWLGAALVEWRAPGLPLLAGAAGQVVRARTRWTFDHQSAADRTLDERTWRSMLYALAALPGNVRAEAFAAHTRRPESLSGARPAERTDAEWLLVARAQWMLSDVAGADLALMRLGRKSSGEPALAVDGTHHRLVTRAILVLGDRLWSTFGVGWDLDAGEGPYDGGGATIVVQF